MTDTQIDKPFQFAVVIDTFNANYSSSPEIMMMHVMMVERHLNYMLNARGQVFLNEVYDHLGVDRIRAGQILGWVYDPSTPRKIKFDIEMPAGRDLPMRVILQTERDILDRLPEM